MDININIRLDAPTGWKRRVLFYVATPIALIAAAAGVVWAGGLHTFQANEPLSASTMNGNFTQVEADIAAVQSQVAAVSTFQGFSGATGGSGYTVTSVPFTPISGYALDFDTWNGAFDAGTGVFTAPVAGYYRFDAGGVAVYGAGYSGQVSFEFYASLHGTLLVGGAVEPPTTSTTPLPSLVTTAHLAAGETVVLKVYATAPIVLGGTMAGYPFRFQGQYLGQ